MLNVRAFAIAAAILWGGTMLLMGWIASSGYMLEWVELMSTVYLGYGPGLIGAVVGALWGAVDGGIGGLFFAWLYNRLSAHFAPSADSGAG